MLGYILVWAGTMLSMSVGFIGGKTWLDKRFNRKQQQGGNIRP